MKSDELPELYRRKSLRVTAVLFSIWLVATFVICYLPRYFDFVVFGWPLNFWLGAQGALVLYVIILCYYAWYMNKLDREFGVDT